jgi:hypothetical protein
MSAPQQDYTEAFVMLILYLGIGVILIGIYLTVTGSIAHGLVQYSKYSLNTKSVSLNGIVVIIMGILISSLPTYTLIKRRIKK